MLRWITIATSWIVIASYTSETLTDGTIQTAVAAYFNNDDSYPHIQTWDTSQVTNMTQLFYGDIALNADISQWDVSSVTSMNYMFSCESEDCEISYVGDLNQWNVSNVKTMKGMFKNSFFNGNLNDWDVSNVTTMNDMFFSTKTFNGDISQWNVSNVIDMSYMFSFDLLFNTDISQWDVSNVTDMRGMFAVVSLFNGDISDWDVSNVSDMMYMFGAATSFNGDLNQWDVSNVADMSNMFQHSRSFNSDINQWNVSNVTSMDYMFYNATSFKQTLCWDTNASYNDMFASSPGFLLTKYACDSYGIRIFKMSLFTLSAIDIILCCAFGSAVLALCFVIRKERRNSAAENEPTTLDSVLNESECNIREALILSSVLRKKIGKDNVSPFHTNMELTDPDNTNPEDDINVWSCPICLEIYREGDDVCKSRNEECLHVFHLSCIKGWLLTSDSCPMCRTDYLKYNDCEMSLKDS